MNKTAFIIAILGLIYCLHATHTELYPIRSTETISLKLDQNETKTARIATFNLQSDMDIQKTMDGLFSAARDESIQGLVLYINHPGGECGPYSAVHDLIKAISIKKPVIAFVVGYAYSAGYMVASAADYIVSASGAGIGAIGTLWTIHKYSDMVMRDDEQDANDTVEVLTAGKYKAVENPLTAPLNSKTRKHLQKIVDENYRYFLNLVASNRGLSLETSKRWAEGREFIAEKALALGLIDQIGTLFDVEEKMIELLKLRKPDSAWSKKVDFVTFETKLPGNESQQE